MLAGFPDDQISSFSHQIKEFEKDYFVISLALPGLDKSKDRRKWGYDFPELLELMDKTIVNYVGNRKFNLMVHDWGAFVGMMYQINTRAK